MNNTLMRLVKEVQFRSPFRRYFFPRYDHNFTPPQLCKLGTLLDETLHVRGSVVEVGCATGTTTIFLNHFLTARGAERDYFCLDTFEGFVSEDVVVEASERGKRAEDYEEEFAVNSRRWFEATMERNQIRRVRAIETDVNGFDFSAVGPIAFCLLDVDLYRPTARCLPEIWDRLAPGGILVVDDCDDTHALWDGAHQAFVEFAVARKLPLEIVEGKLGVLRRPAA